jgi:tRNA pseudouridine38-40 synthase
MKNILLTIEYDGTAFFGWQRQPGKRTVQGELERVLSLLCGEAVTIAGTSRTDAGVHAYRQQATLQGDFGIPIERIPIAANNLLAGPGPYAVGDVRILGAVEMPADFHARFSSVGKKYIYRIYNSDEPKIMLRNYFYWVKHPLDLVSMKKAVSYLTGKHDFKSFMAAGGREMKTTVRTIYKADVVMGRMREEVFFSYPEKEILFEITGDGFLYNMVRIIAGTLVEVGLGKISPDAMKEIVQEKDRQRAGHTAPPQGLYLVEVYYNKEDCFKEGERKNEN